MRCFLIAVLLCSGGACGQDGERVLARCKPECLTSLRPYFDGKTFYSNNVFMCDGIKDCSDESDEDFNLCRRPVKPAVSTRFLYGIKGRKCPSTWFFCADGSNCIISRYVCDDHKDCRDGSDEAEFCHGLNERKRKASDKIVY